MLTVSQLQNAARALEQIANLEKLILSYQAASEITVAIPAFSPIDMRCRFTVPASELVDAVVAVLQRQVAEMQAELRNLGITDD